MEELSEGAIKSVLRLLSAVVRLLIWLIWEVFFEEVAWYVGWPVTRVLSFGQYPREGFGENDRASGLTHFIVSAIGVVSLAGLAMLLMQLTGNS